MADNNYGFLSAHGGRILCMKALETRRQVPLEDARRVAAWFGDINRLPHTDLSVQMLYVFGYVFHVLVIIDRRLPCG